MTKDKTEGDVGVETVVVGRRRIVPNPGRLICNPLNRLVIALLGRGSKDREIGEKQVRNFLIFLGSQRSRNKGKMENTLEAEAKDKGKDVGREASGMRRRNNIVRSLFPILLPLPPSTLRSCFLFYFCFVFALAFTGNRPMTDVQTCAFLVQH